MAAAADAWGLGEWTGAIGHSARPVFPPGLVMLPCAVAPLLGALGGLVSEVSARNLGLDGVTMPAMCPPLLSTKRTSPPRSPLDF